MEKHFEDVDYQKEMQTYSIFSNPTDVLVKRLNLILLYFIVEPMYIEGNACL